MGENKALADALEKARKMGKRAALATVVRVSGSAYRREGAKMLIDDSGKMTGTISGGGCLEPDVAEVAKKVISDARPILKHYDMDEDLVWGLGLGCPGTVDIYIEPIPWNELRINGGNRKKSTMNSKNESYRDPFEEWITCLKQGCAGILCKLLQSSSSLNLSFGARLFISENSAPVGGLGDKRLNQIVIKVAREKLNQLYPKSETRTFPLSSGEWAEVFFDVNTPPSKLLIFGAGDDAIPLVKFGSQLGFNTTVVDSRPSYTTSERFPEAKLILANPSSLQERVQIDRRTYVVLMNHHLQRDQICLHFALNSRAPYIGALGPLSRRKRMFKALKREGVVFSEEQLARLYNPVGLNIGAESSEEIAISILAEILSVRNGYPGGFLRGHERIHTH